MGKIVERTIQIKNTLRLPLLKLKFFSITVPKANKHTKKWGIKIGMTNSGNLIFFFVDEQPCEPCEQHGVEWIFFDKKRLLYKIL